MAHSSKRVTIAIVGGPIGGSLITRPAVDAVDFPVPKTGMALRYTLRRLRDRRGRCVEILAPAGQAVDPRFLAHRRLVLEH